VFNSRGDKQLDCLWRTNKNLHQRTKTSKSCQKNSWAPAHYNKALRSMWSSQSPNNLKLLI